MGDETKIEMQQVKQGVEAAGSLIERYLVRVLGPLGRKIAGSSPLGKLMSFIGLLAVVVSLILIFSNAMWFGTQQRRGHKYVNITYERKGYGIVFVSGIGLFAAGMLLKEKERGRKKKK